MQLNALQQSNWSINFSNLPDMLNLKDMAYFDNFVKSFTLPNYDLPIDSSNFMGARIRQPISKTNVDVSPFMITFRTTEDIKNYYYLMEWAMRLKYGEPDTTYDGDLREYTIKTVTLNILDNEKRPRVKVTFSKCLIESLSSLGLEMGNTGEVLFTASFAYEEVNLEVVTI